MDDFFQRMREQQEMTQRLVEDSAKYFREKETAIMRMQDLVRGIDTGALARTVAAVNGSNLALRLRRSLTPLRPPLPSLRHRTL